MVAESLTRDAVSASGCSGDVSSSARGAAALDATPAALRARAASENFPVALRWLPSARRHDLLAVYDTARLIDQVGDDAPGDRLELLDALEHELRAAFAGEARHPVLRALEPTLVRCALPLDPFLRLLEANRWDQRQPAMASWEELRAYCALSANPVGELVLRIFGQADPGTLTLSDDVCTALQLVEHCQDVAEDLAAGRIYLPASERARCGCTEADLAGAPASSALRRLIALQVERARRLLASGEALVARLRGAARPAVAAYVAGGLATCAALERAGFDPNSTPVRPRRRDRLRASAALLWRRGRR